MNIKEIARRAEVSISTVSRVINNTAKVSEEARKRVEAVLEETGYRPNSLARELQQNKTNTIGLLMSAGELGMSSLSIAINAITDVLKEKGYNLMLANARFSTDEELNFFRVFQEKRVDGILYFATEITAQHERLLNNYPIPIVVIGQKADNLSYPSVIHNDYQGAMAATQYLLQMGHRQLGYIGVALTDEAVGFERHRGYEAALVENGLEPKQMSYAEGDFSMESGYQAMKGFIEQKTSASYSGVCSY
jgi:LacI family transcriptional regulator, sucrose operon repressor